MLLQNALIVCGMREDNCRRFFILSVLRKIGRFLQDLIFSDFFIMKTTRKNFSFENNSVSFSSILYYNIIQLLSEILS